MIDKNKLEQLSKVSLKSINKDTLVDIRDVTIDTTLQPYERLEKYINEIQNPYIFLFEDTVVKIEYCKTDNTLDKAVFNILSSYYDNNL